MPRPRNIRKRAKRDANHNEIVRILESLGATFLDTSGIGGALDGTVGYAGIDQRIEIKNPNVDSTHRKLTADEEREFSEWKGRPPVVVETQDDAVELLNRMRKDSVSLGKK